MNILVTGANGFIASNIIKTLELNNTNVVFKATKSSLNLYSLYDVRKFIEDNKIESIIHCAIEGGKRLTVDDKNIVYNNILMVQNLLACKIKGLFINIASGSEFDRNFDIINIKETEIYNRIPTDYYGFSKNVISKLINTIPNGINLRLFGCFNKNEHITRMIRSNLNNYILKKPMIIHQDKYMDFVYIDDLCNLIVNILNGSLKQIKDINVVYNKKYKLSDITNIINNLANYKVPILIENTKIGLSYSGDGTIFNNLNINYKGLEFGIKECYTS
jgi:nucleoside-diphosphate-sugar epimerase